MHTTSPRFVMAALAAALLLAGCGSGGERDATPRAPDAAGRAATLQPSQAPGGSGAHSESGAAGTLDVCGLLTTAEVEEALGEPVEAEMLTDIDCRYETTGDVVEARDITVNVLRPVTMSDDVFELTVSDAAGPDDTTERIGGLGDAAILTVTPHAAIVQVKAGNTWLTVSAFGPAGTVWPPDLLTGLTQRAVQRLP